MKLCHGAGLGSDKVIFCNVSGIAIHTDFPGVHLKVIIKSRPLDLLSCWELSTTLICIPGVWLCGDARTCRPSLDVRTMDWLSHTFLYQACSAVGWPFTFLQEWRHHYRWFIKEANYIYFIKRLGYLNSLLYLGRNTRLSPELAECHPHDGCKILLNHLT